MSVRLVCFLLACIALGDAAKILGVFQFTCKSHYILGSTLLQELAARGHEVTMVSPFELDPPMKNYKDVVLTGVLAKREYNMRIVVNPNTTILEKVSQSITATRDMSRMVLGNENLQKFLQTAPKHDLVIQMYAFNEAMLGIGHKLNATTIAFSVVDSTFVNYLTGNPAPYAYIPNIILSYTNNMSFYQRLVNTVISTLFDLTLHFLNLPFQQTLLDEFFPGAPKITELMDNIDLTLINTHYSTEPPRPYLPNIIQIGGFHLEHKEPMPDDLKQYLDTSANGVILFSFGTNVRSADLEKSKLSAILKAFSKTKYDILWKFESDDIPTDKPKNVRFTKWVPQRTVLAHPKVKAFVTHGGLGSTVESIYYGVPMICIPFFGDQSKNAADTTAKGYGITLQLDDISEKTITAAVKEITENPAYAQKVQSRSDLYRNQEMNPMDKAVYWVEHVIKYGHAKHLKSQAHLIPWYQYMLLDVFGFIAVVLLTITSVFYYLIKFLINLCCGSKKSKTSKKAKSS